MKVHPSIDGIDDIDGVSLNVLLLQLLLKLLIPLL